MTFAFELSDAMDFCVKFECEVWMWKIITSREFKFNVFFDRSLVMYRKLNQKRNFEILWKWESEILFWMLQTLRILFCLMTTSSKEIQSSRPCQLKSLLEIFWKTEIKFLFRENFNTKSFPQIISYLNLFLNLKFLFNFPWFQSFLHKLFHPHPSKSSNPLRMFSGGTNFRSFAREKPKFPSQVFN